MKKEKLICLLELEFVAPAEDDFEKALKKHMELHEGVCLSDLLKFLYQSSLGSFHLFELMDQTKMKNWIKRNLEKTTPSGGLLAEELLGRKWVRLNFGPYKKRYGNDYQKIHKAFMKVKNVKPGRHTEFRRLLEELIDVFQRGRIRSISDEPKALCQILDFLEEYKKSAHTPVHHSKSYMLKNTSDYLVIPRSSLYEIT
jgi:hypothetical protein